ncbi:MAG: hypothetical protein ACMG6H_02340 [Acidobacteriota bacterium]
MRSLWQSQLISACIVVLLHPLNALAFDGRLLDAGTGKPAAGVWVFGQWQVGGGFVISHSACVLAVTRANDKGEFTLVAGDGFLGRLFGQSNRTGVYTYKPGYMDRLPHAETTNDYLIEPDTRPILKRLEYLSYLLGITDCGTQYVLDHKAALLPLYRAIHEEAVGIAKTRREQQVLVSIASSLDLLEIGPDAASAKAKRTSQMLHDQIRRGEQ